MNSGKRKAASAPLEYYSKTPLRVERQESVKQLTPFKTLKKSHGVLNYKKLSPPQSALPELPTKKSISRSSSTPCFLKYSHLNVPSIYKFHSSVIKASKKKLSQKKFPSVMHKDYSSSTLDSLPELNNDVSFIFKKSKMFSKEDYENREMEKKYLKRNCSPEIKEILKQEINVCKSKLDSLASTIYEPERVSKVKVIPKCLQRLRGYQCLSQGHPILEINEVGAIPEMLKDGKLIYQLMMDGTKEIIKRKHQVIL